MKKFFAPVVAIGLFWANPALAHCPLCTIGAGVIATLALWLGVSTMVIGVVLGGFAAALGLWVARIIKRKLFHYQDTVVATVVFLSTILPILPIAGGEKGSVYISFAGGYGSLLNRTYVIDFFLVGSLVGALMVIIAPYISRRITQTRSGKTMPYQGVAITFLLLVVSSVILQLAL